MATSSAFSVLRDEFYARGFSYLQDGVGDGTLSHARANRFLNQGYMDVLTADDWPFLLTSKNVTGATIPLTVGSVGQLKTIEQVVNEATDTKLIPVNRNDIPGGQLAQTGTPTHYWVERDAASSVSAATVRVWPVSTTNSITVYYYYLPEPLSANGDLHVIPAWYESAIIQYACAYAYMDSDNPQGAQLARSDGDRLVMQMRMNLMWDSLDFPAAMQRANFSADS